MAVVDGKSPPAKLFDLGTSVLSGNDYVLEIRPIEDLFKLLGLNIAKLEPMVMDSR